MKKLHFPALRAIAEELRDINSNVEGECDVRLQVYPNGKWVVRSGDAQYDQDHTGFWGAASIPGIVNGKEQKFDSLAVARDLLEQAKDQHASYEVFPEEQERRYAAKAKPPPKEGDKCPHGNFWYKEVESENPAHPVGSLSLDCDACRPVLTLASPPTPLSNITEVHKATMDALRDPSYDNFALFSAYFDGHPCSVIVALNRAGHGRDVLIQPIALMLEGLPDSIMDKLRDHDGTSATSETH